MTRALRITVMAALVVLSLICAGLIQVALALPTWAHWLLAPLLGTTIGGIGGSVEGLYLRRRKRRSERRDYAAADQDPQAVWRRVVTRYGHPNMPTDLQVVGLSCGHSQITKRSARPMEPCSFCTGRAKAEGVSGMSADETVWDEAGMAEQAVEDLRAELDAYGVDGNR